MRRKAHIHSSHILGACRMKAMSGPPSSTLWPFVEQRVQQHIWRLGLHLEQSRSIMLGRKSGGLVQICAVSPWKVPSACLLSSLCCGVLGLSLKQQPQTPLLALKDFFLYSESVAPGALLSDLIFLGNGCLDIFLHSFVLFIWQGYEFSKFLLPSAFPLIKILVFK